MLAKQLPLQITHVSISNKHRCKVVFVKDGKASAINTITFHNRHAARKHLINPLYTLFG